MLSRFIAVAMLVCAQLAFAATPDPAPNASLSALFDREFKRDLQEFPETATFLGIKN